jgi:hypothetical protein
MFSEAGYTILDCKAKKKERFTAHVEGSECKYRGQFFFGVKYN